MRVLKRGIDLNANPVIDTSFLWSLHEFDSIKYGPLSKDLSEEQHELISQYWGRYTSNYDYKWVQFYYQRTGDFDVRYIPHEIYYSIIDRFLNPPHKATGLDDKRLYHQLFPTISQPDNLIIKAGGLLLTNTRKPVLANEAFDICKSKGKVVCKEPVYSCGGHGVELLVLPNDEERLIELLNDRSNDYIFQEYICQHRDLQSFHPKSVNTIRIITYLRENGEVVILSSVLRMGSNDSFVDNVSSGGCTCGIEDDGRLKPIGYSNELYKIKAHPNGETFIGKVVPSFKEVQSNATALHYSFPYFAILAWDFAIDENGKPVLIEVNMKNASIDFMQLNNGPLFGEYTEEVLSRVFRNHFINF